VTLLALVWTIVGSIVSTAALILALVDRRRLIRDEKELHHDEVLLGLAPPDDKEVADGDH
jgi:hypothetical protein